MRNKLGSSKKNFIKDLEIIKNLVFRDIKSRYSGSVFGIFWSILTPLFLITAISFIFIRVIKMEMIRYPIFVLSGILPWFFLSNSLLESSTSLTNNARFLNQFTIRKEILPVSCVLSNFIIFLIGFVAMLPIFIAFKFKVLYLLPILIPVVIFQLLFTMGISLICSCINVFFRDLFHLLNIGLMVWFWMTPVFYSIDMIPEKYKFINFVNPMASFIKNYQNILYYGHIPEARFIIGAVLWTTITIFCGCFIFRRLEPSIIKKF